MMPNDTTGSLDEMCSTRQKKPIISLPFHLNEFPDIFKRKGFNAKMQFLFWRLLCPYPDQTRIGMWWYGVSGRIASYFAARANK